VKIDNTAKTIAKVRDGCKLKDIAATFRKQNFTIPHGECLLVCIIGGHVQTGGFRHLQRCFDLALDHVWSFDIVMTNGDVRII